MNKPLGSKTRSILDEINSFVPSKNKEEVIESRAHHVISSAINLLRIIEENYSPEEADLLTKRFLSSIKGEDPERFCRVIKRLREEKSNGPGTA